MTQSTGLPSAEVQAELRSALLAAFLPKPIAAQLFALSQGSWELYDHPNAFVQGVATRTWDAIEHTFIETHSDSIGYLEPEPFAALLPAYLLHLVQHEAFNETPFHVAGALTRPRDADDQKLFDDRIEQLTSPQCVVVKRVIEALLSCAPMEDVMKTALASYWKDLPPTSELAQNRNEKP